MATTPTTDDLRAKVAERTSRRTPGPRGPGPHRVGECRPRAGLGGTPQRRGRGRAAGGRGLHGPHHQHRRRGACGDRPQDGAGRRADGAALRPPRRAARERPRRLGHPAVRADRARRPPLRPRRRRRQGRHRHPPGRAADLRRRPAGQRRLLRRGRGGGRLRDPARAAGGEPRRPARRRHRDRRLRQLGHRRPGPDDQPARAGADGRRGPHADPRRPLRHVGRPGPRLADDPGPAASRRCTTTAATSPSTACTPARRPTSTTPRSGCAPSPARSPAIGWIGEGSTVERLWTKPALSITGLDAPKVAGACNTLVPAARCRISMRIAPGDTTANAVDAAARAPREARALGRRALHDRRRHRRGDPDRRDRAGVRRRALRLRRRLGRHRPGRHGRRRLDPVHRGVPRGLPRGARPRHRRRGPRHPRPRRQRGPPPRGVREGAARRGRCCCATWAESYGWRRSAYPPSRGASEPPVARSQGRSAARNGSSSVIQSSQNATPRRSGAVRPSRRAVLVLHRPQVAAGQLGPGRRHRRGQRLRAASTGQTRAPAGSRARRARPHATSASKRSLRRARCDAVAISARADLSPDRCSKSSRCRSCQGTGRPSASTFTSTTRDRARHRVAVADLGLAA